MFGSDIVQISTKPIAKEDWITAATCPELKIDIGGDVSDVDEGLRAEILYRLSNYPGIRAIDMKENHFGFNMDDYLDRKYASFKKLVDSLSEHSTRNDFADVPYRTAIFKQFKDIFRETNNFHFLWDERACCIDDFFSMYYDFFWRSNEFYVGGIVCKGDPARR